MVFTKQTQSMNLNTKKHIQKKTSKMVNINFTFDVAMMVPDRED